MAGVGSIPVVDHHCHLSPTGEGLAAVARFRAAGGTHLFLATQNYDARVPTDLEGYRRQFELTERLARRSREECGVEVYLVVAPYPIDLLAAAESLGLEPALALQRAALDLAGRWVRERRAVAIGEVGWPHFAVESGVAAASRSAFQHALEVAREAGCPAVVHGPDLDAAGWRGLGDDARRAGLEPGRVIKHYARSPRPPGTEVVASYLAQRELVTRVLEEPGPWFLETDFLDDPRRPGAVLDLATVPRRARALAERGPSFVERLRVPFLDSVERVYGLRPERRAA
ncbi:MAG TPA: TatD family hydrolase [Thermoplasmata archaeon]|nr:TatD family hydrolase [Thermoplasmata archaeon]